MAPQTPRPSNHRRRPSSGNPTPTRSPRKPAERQRSPSPERGTPGESSRRKSSSPEKRTPGDSAKRKSGNPEKRTSGGTPKRNAQATEKRRSHVVERDPEKRRSNPPSPRKASPKKSPAKTSARAVVAAAAPRDGGSSSGSSNPLSLDSLAKLNEHNARAADKARKERDKEDKEREKKERAKEKVVTGRVLKERMKHKHRRKDSGSGEKRKPRVVSGGEMEAGRRRRGGYLPPTKKKRRKVLWIVIGLMILLLVILIPVGVLVVGKQGGNSGSGPDNSNLKGINQADIPAYAKGSYLDPFTWYDTQDFNVTFTNDTVGGLSVMGLNSNWDDSVQANQYVPPLDKAFDYGKMPIRGVNVGGWLALEPFIAPSLFNSYDPKLKIIDESSLCEHLGPASAAQTLEKHYSSFINAQSFTDIRAAGFDHVRIPFSYWAVTTYPGDSYVPKISWRYLLRGIEYARQNGLRVNLDVHGLPGSQNGWNHSGRQGAIGWLNGTDGALNGQRSLDLHGQLATFFAQPRYKNVVGLYGLVNEPKMISLQTSDVIAWTTKAIEVVRKAGITQYIIFADGFLGLLKWKGQLQVDKNLILDAHQYTIFNNDQIAFDHKKKLTFACAGWSGQMQQSVNTATG